MKIKTYCLCRMERVMERRFVIFWSVSNEIGKFASCSSTNKCMESSIYLQFGQVYDKYEWAKLGIC